MNINPKDYYASEGWRTGLIFVAAANFFFGLFRLIRGILVFNEYHYTVAHFILYSIVGFIFIYYYLKTRYVPVAQAGTGWIIIKQGIRNRGLFRSQSGVKDYRIKKNDVKYLRNGIFSLKICTIDEYKYSVYGISNRHREDLAKKLMES